MKRRHVLAGLCVGLSLLALFATMACGPLTQRRLQGRWESVDTPVRTLDLYEDGTFSRRLSGKKLGFLSDILGPDKGTWRVEGEALVLATRGENGAVSEQKLPINELGDDAVVLAGERWTRKSLPGAESAPATAPAR